MRLFKNNVLRSTCGSRKYGRKENGETYKIVNFQNLCSAVIKKINLFLCLIN
jgi:hypothetical protein